MKCPNCADSLLVMSERQGVEIDYCPQCRGVWLDRGELDKVLEKAGAQAVALAPAAPQQHHDRAPAQAYRSHEYERDYPKHDKYYKQKSWLNEIFD
jgi:Zn-finger nucleic acid-binding protein